MQSIQETLRQIYPDKKIYFQTTEMKDKFVQGATVLKVGADRILVETQGRQRTLEVENLISLEV